MTQAYPDSIMPPATNPFFIVTSPYTQGSAGITVLHLLCHYLNRAGANAWLVHYLPETAPLPAAGMSLQIQTEIPLGLQAPLITQDIIELYDRHRLTPIVIYPEIFDNPLQAAFFGRYILNYPGKLAAKYEQESNFDLAYSQILADHCAAVSPHRPPPDTLFIPTVDLAFWTRRPSPPAAAVATTPPG
jgi:hypothetical protein